MDASQGLRDAENALRDFISLLLSSLRPDWIEHCGVSDDRVQKWKERKLVEAKRQESGVVEERLIYYADFYDIKTILKKNWANVFGEALGDWKTFEVYLSELEKLRDVDAHRRELLPHQKHLVLGISGAIRGRIVRYRSKMETPNDCFPRIESARDSLGHLWTPADPHAPLRQVATSSILHPGDVIEFVVTASDPENLPLEFTCLRIGVGELQWQSSPSLEYTVLPSDISERFYLEILVRSTREYHARGSYDDKVTFSYCVLPMKRVQ